MDLGQGIRKALSKLTGGGLVDENAVKELVKDLQRVLITNDVEVKLVFQLTKRVQDRVLKEKPLPGVSLREHVVKVVYEELQTFLGEKYSPVLGKQKILLLGLYGQGKTTTVGKMARFFQGKGLKTCVVAGDVHRPAAFEQLKQLSEQVHCGFFGLKGEKAAAKIAGEALALQAKYDVLIFDSAGRSAFDAELVSELRDVASAFGPDQTLLVVSADLGQVAGKQAKQFNDAVPLSGVIVTRMDGSGKGGGALSSVAASGAKVAFVGTGEKMDALRVFDPSGFVAQLVGFPDLSALLEKVKEISDEEVLEKALEEGKLDYASFLAQMRAMKKMGPLKQVMQMLGAYDLPEELVGKSEEKLASFEAAVLSMTPAERKNPDLMRSSSRQERVAKGSGLKPQEVKELVANFDRVSKMFKGIRKNKGFMKGLSKMMPGLGKMK